MYNYILIGRAALYLLANQVTLTVGSGRVSVVTYVLCCTCGRSTWRCQCLAFCVRTRHARGLHAFNFAALSGSHPVDQEVTAARILHQKCMHYLLAFWVGGWAGAGRGGGRGLGGGGGWWRWGVYTHQSTSS